MNYYKEVESLIKKNEINKGVRTLRDNSETLYTYWHIGKLIVEAQGGAKLAKYGNNLIKEWDKKLSEKYGKGYDYTNLSRMRLLYIAFPIVGSLSQQLTWTHYRYILPIKNANERNYYINQVILNNLSVRDLRCEIKNKSFDRLSYKDKTNIEIITESDKLTIEDMLKDPIILKSDIETKELNEAIIHKCVISLLENKFLEMGTGFALVGHEYKIIIDNKTYHIDLLFYNYLLNAFVVIEVKTRSLKPQDIGQLEFYVGYVENTRKIISTLSNIQQIRIFMLQHIY